MDGIIDSFLNVLARHIVTGPEIESSIIKGILTSDGVGEKCYQTFAKERLMASEEKKVDYFETIKKNNLKTGLKKTKKK